MNRLIYGVLTITGLTSCASAAGPTPGSTPAQAPGSETPPLTVAALKPPLDSLAFYVGTWQCKGTYFATKDQPEETWEARMEVEPELDGFWLSVRMFGPKANRSAEHKGYDPDTKKWIHLVVGNSHGWVLVTSPGWEGSKMVFASYDPADKTRATFTKLSDTSYSHVVTRETDGVVANDWQKVCTKK